MPEKDISSFAAKKTGLQLRHGELYHNGSPVKTVPQKEALTLLIDFIRRNSVKECILVAHNSKTFDSKVLVRHLSEFNLLQDFTQVCQGFGDSMPIFKELYPERKKAKIKQPYSQVKLCKDLRGHTYSAHNAMEDVRALQILCAPVSTSRIYKHSFTTTSVCQSIEYCAQKSKNRSTLHGLIPVVSQHTIDKMAGSGLKLEHLKLAHARDPISGLFNVLSEKRGRQTRVTNKLEVIDNIQRYVQEICDSAK